MSVQCSDCTCCDTDKVFGVCSACSINEWCSASTCVRSALPATPAETEERETAWRAWNEVPEGAALIPAGEPCPICGPKGHGRHVDDSYGSCVTCREYVAHTDNVSHPVAFPCAASRLPAETGLTTLWDRVFTLEEHKWCGEKGHISKATILALIEDL